MLYSGSIHRAASSRPQAHLVIGTNPLIFDDADAASGNDKLHAFAMTLDPPDVIRDQKECALHQNHLIVTSLLKSLGTSITSRMYSMAAVLRTQGYFLRLHRAAHDILDDEANFTVLDFGGPTAAERDFTAEVMQYLLCHDGLAYESSDNVRGMGCVYSECKLRHMKPEDRFLYKHSLKIRPSDLL